MIKKVIFALIVLLFFSLLSEAALRFYFFAENGFRKSPLISYVNDDSLGYTPVPGFSLSYFTMDSLGFRSNGNRQTGGKTILCIGGSTTFGTGNSDKETFPAQLESVLRESGNNVRVINAGVSGYSSRQLALRHTGLLNKTRPDIVIINSCWNTGHHVQKYFKNDHLPTYWLFEHSLVFRSVDRMLRKSAISLHYRVWPDDSVLLARQDSIAESIEITRNYRKDMGKIVGLNLLNDAKTIILYPPSLIYSDNIESAIACFAGSKYENTDTLFFEIGLAGNKIRDKSWLAIQDLKDGGSLYYLDLNPEFKSMSCTERAAFFYDQIHPIAAGNKIIAKTIAEFIIENNLL